MRHIAIEENRLHLVVEISDEGDVRLLHFSVLPFEEARLGGPDSRPFYRLYELQATGFGRMENHGLRYMQNSPGIEMAYRDHRDYRNQLGRVLEIRTAHPASGLEVTTSFQFYDGLSLARCWNTITNGGPLAQGIEYLSSFSLTGISKEGLMEDEDKLRLYTPGNGWQAELQWRRERLSQRGFFHLSQEGNSSHRIQETGVGSWSCSECLPMAMLENLETGSMLFWQIETTGGWHWEICDTAHQLALNISGPSEIEHHWWKELAPGQSFETVKVCVGSVAGGVDQAMDQLTRYRRAIRRPNEDNRSLPIIFNDYMNCLWASPTTEKEIPMIDAAAQVGCEYYVVDAGWYTDGDWWTDVGEWIPSPERFPGGIRQVMDHIRRRGMIPGIWLEIEVMGLDCPKLKDTDDSWFFTRHGRRVIDRQRYQLDFRCPAVREYATQVVQRMVEEYGVGYIKMDYNINAGIGTQRDCDSPGDGLLEHQRAYLEWLDQIFARYPYLIIENCSSGGMRMDYAMLARCSIQSTSDQSDYLKYAVIAANAPSAVTPEQAAIWSYPMPQSTREQIIFNVVNACLLRVHQSGNMSALTPQNRELVKEGLAYYKSIRRHIPQAIPFWPLGLHRQGDPWVCLGLRWGDKRYVAVWRTGGDQSTVLVPLGMAGLSARAACHYPRQDGACAFTYHQASGTLSVSMPQAPMARIIEITPEA